MVDKLSVKCRDFKKNYNYFSFICLLLHMLQKYITINKGKTLQNFLNNGKENYIKACFAIITDKKRDPKKLEKLDHEHPT